MPRSNANRSITNTGSTRVRRANRISIVKSEFGPENILSANVRLDNDVTSGGGQVRSEMSWVTLGEESLSVTRSRFVVCLVLFCHRSIALSEASRVFFYQDIIEVASENGNMFDTAMAYVKGTSKEET